MIFERSSKHKKALLVIFILILIGGIGLLVWQNFFDKPQTETAAVGWQRVVEAVNNCEAKQVFQSHSLDVTVRLKNGSEISAIEPQIDDIIKIAIEAEPRCGRIIMATE